MSTINKYYVVWIWHIPWIYTTWKECRANILKFPKARYKKFSTYEKAKVAYSESHEKHWWVKKQSDGTIIRSCKHKIWFVKNLDKIIASSIVSDGACSYAWSNSGKIEWQVIDMKTWEYVVKSKVFENGTNNIAEFLWLCDAIEYRNIIQSSQTIFCDSKIALWWVRDMECRTNAEEIPIELKLLIEESIEYLQWLWHIEKLYLWETKKWWENPADYWRK